MNKSLIAIASLLTLSACMQAQDPKQVAEQYWQAIKAGDIATARTLVSSDSQQAFDDYQQLPADKKLPLDAVAVTTSSAHVTTVMNSGEISKQFDTILVLQNGQWVIDARQTRIPQPDVSLQQHFDELGNQLGDSLENNMSGMEKSLDEGLQLLNEFMQEGTRDMGKTLDKGLQEMNEKMRAAIEKLKQRREQQLQQAPTPPTDATPQSGHDEGMI